VRALWNFRMPGSAAVQLTCGSLALLATIAPPGRARAGAWLLPEGSGQIIAGPIYSETTRYFDARGQLVPVPYYKKFELGTYIEYGLTNRATLYASPGYDKVRTPEPSQNYKGLGESAGGVRLGVYRDDWTVVSVQGGVLTPGPSVVNSTGPSNPRRAFGFEMRGLVGKSFEVATLPAFVDVQGGYRYYLQNQPGEWRLDLTFGVRPDPRLLWLVQAFNVFSTAGGGGFVRYSWHKVATSIVVELQSHWAVQLGGFMTVAGISAGREKGPFAAVWYRF
jgi:hypothetical protein